MNQKTMTKPEETKSATSAEKTSPEGVAVAEAAKSPAATSPHSTQDMERQTSADDWWHSAVDRLFDWPDRLFKRTRPVRTNADWMERTVPSADWFPTLTRDWLTTLDAMMESPFRGEPDIRVEEQLMDGEFIVRADLPGIDPDRDVDITVGDGRLHIRAERRSETKEEDKGRYRSEVRYGSFTRIVPIPRGLTENDVKASYKDGVLEVRIPAPEPTKKSTKVPIARA